MSKKIIIINGSGGKGKDTFITCCEKYISIINVSSVDKIKEAAMILNWNNDKSEKGREFLSKIKELSIKYNNYPYEYIKNKIYHFTKSSNKIMFIHIRESEEIIKIKNDFNCKTLLLKNNNVKDIKSNKSDSNIYNFEYDYIIENNTDLKDLEIQAYHFIKSIFK